MQRHEPLNLLQSGINSNDGTWEATLAYHCIIRYRPRPSNTKMTCLVACTPIRLSWHHYTYTAVEMSLMFWCISYQGTWVVWRPYHLESTIPRAIIRFSYILNAEFFRFIFGTRSVEVVRHIDMLLIRSLLLDHKHSSRARSLWPVASTTKLQYLQEHSTSKDTNSINTPSLSFSNSRYISRGIKTPKWARERGSSLGI